MVVVSCRWSLVFVVAVVFDIDAADVCPHDIDAANAIPSTIHSSISAMRLLTIPTPMPMPPYPNSLSPMPAPPLSICLTPEHLFFSRVSSANGLPTSANGLQSQGNLQRFSVPRACGVCGVPRACGVCMGVCMGECMGAGYVW